MKLLKRVFSGVIVLAMVLSLAACGSKSVVGTWKGTNNNNEYEYIFNEDGTGSVSVSGITLTTEYKVDGDKITMTMSFLGQTQTDELTYSINGKTLTITDGEDQLVLDKQ